MDEQTSAAWESTIYMSWLACLRELSTPTTDGKCPEAMRTRTWAMKTLNAQLASWTQLRHDTILYAKQSYTGVGQCVYPAGFVEPRVAFWQHLRATVSRAADLLTSLPYTGTYLLVTNRLQVDPATGDLAGSPNIYCRPLSLSLLSTSAARRYHACYNTLRLDSKPRWAAPRFAV
jgi:hypothetical protein